MKVDIIYLIGKPIAFIAFHQLTSNRWLLASNVTIATEIPNRYDWLVLDWQQTVYINDSLSSGSKTLPIYSYNWEAFTYNTLEELMAAHWEVML